VAEGGAYINNERVQDADQVVPTTSLLQGRYLVLRRGKKTIAGADLTPPSADLTPSQG
jgi:tyrosyl-tRNA synthetase